MGNILNYNEVEKIQGLFSNFIKMDGPNQPLPLLAKGLFEVFDNHYDVIEPVLSELQTLEYCSKKFGAYFPFLIDVTSLNEEEIESKRKVKEIQRYLSKPLRLKERDYLVCKEFYIDKGGYKKLLYSWFCGTFEVEQRKDIIGYEKETYSNINIQGLVGAVNTKTLADNNQPIEETTVNKNEIERLNQLLIGASSILFNAEKEAISSLIKMYTAEGNINNQQVKKVELVYKRLKTAKDVLSEIEL